MNKQWVMIVLAVLALSGCESVGFYSQATWGQVRILMKRQPVDKLLAASETDEALRAQLMISQAALRFAENELALPVAGRYQSYVATGKKAVVWNVFAAPVDQLQLVQWCYPIAGCSGYRGYFSQASAQRYAQRLQVQGLDVAVGPVAAYSTLGWFDDPLLDTFIDRPEQQLVGLLFHELAHVRLYLPGDTTFNESYATAVEIAGLQRWSASGDEAESSAMRRYLQRKRFNQFLMEWRERLAIAYSTLPDDDLEGEKARLFARIEEDYEQRKAAFGGARFDGFFSSPLNNARLAAVGAYWEHVPAFLALFNACDDFAKFHATVEQLSELSEPQRNALLRGLALREHQPAHQRDHTGANEIQCEAVP